MYSAKGDACAAPDVLCGAAVRVDDDAVTRSKMTMMERSVVFMGKFISK